MALIGQILAYIFFLSLAYVTGYNVGTSHNRQNMLTIMRRFKNHFVGEWLNQFGDKQDKQTI